MLTAGAPEVSEDEADDPGEVTTEDLGDVGAGDDQVVMATAASEATPVTPAEPATASTTKKRAATRSTSTTSRVRSAPASPTATTAAKAVTARVAASPPPPPTTAPPATPAASADDVWDKLAMCESGNTNDHDAPYYGYWQFSEETWHGIGETGLPDDFSRDRQLAAAKRLQAVSGWAPWPECSRRLGLR